MMEVLQEYEGEGAAHLQRWNMGFAFLLQVWQQLNDAVPPPRWLEVWQGGEQESPKGCRRYAAAFRQLCG
jgi:hypothetical protein